MRNLRVLVVGSLAAMLGFLIGNLAIPSLNARPPASGVEQLATLPQMTMPPEPERVVPPGEAETRLSFAPVMREVAPSVVNVYATTVRRASSSPFAGDPFFERFFGGRGFQSRPQQGQSLGSGVISEASGVILTNSHLVEGATDIRIATADEGFAVGQPSAFDFRLATHPIGSTVAIDYVRRGQRGTIPLTLAGAPAIGPDASAVLTGNTRFAGVTVETMNPAIAQQLGLAFNARGVVVHAVQPGSPGQRLGIERGDVVLNLNGRDMTDAKIFEQFATARPDTWQITLQRGGRVCRSVVNG